MVMYGGRRQTFLGKNRGPGLSGTTTDNTDRAHCQNFIDTIRANDPAILNGNVEEGHRSCALIHMANTSYRLGRSLDFDPEQQRTGGNMQDPFPAPCVGMEASFA